MSTLLTDNHIGIKRMSMHGQVSKNVDYGIGYAICWQDVPYKVNSQKNQRYGAFLQDIICRCIQQADFLNKTCQSDVKYEQVKGKLFQALAILQNSLQNEQKR